MCVCALQGRSWLAAPWGALGGLAASVHNDPQMNHKKILGLLLVLGLAACATEEAEPLDSGSEHLFGEEREALEESSERTMALALSGGDAPKCFGARATIYVSQGVVVGGPLDGRLYRGTLTGTRGSDVIVGTTNADTILGEGGGDIICSLGGADTITGRSVSRLDAGSGNDRVTLTSGTDALLYGGAGDDTFTLDYVSGRVDGGSDNDNISAAEGVVELWGASGRDRLALSRTRNPGSGLYGGPGDDTLLLTTAEAIAFGEDGNDTFQLRTARGAFDAGSGLDTFDVALGADATLYGRDGDDTFRVEAAFPGGLGRVEIFGGDGDDAIRAINGEVVVWAESGDDYIELAGNPTGTFEAGEGDDTLVGNASSNVLYGGPGADQILGYGGDDVINAGEDDDDDAVDAGSGRDTCFMIADNDDALNCEL